MQDADAASVQDTEEDDDEDDPTAEETLRLIREQTGEVDGDDVPDDEEDDLDEAGPAAPDEDEDPEDSIARAEAAGAIHDAEAEPGVPPGWLCGCTAPVLGLGMQPARPAAAHAAQVSLSDRNWADRICSCSMRRQKGAQALQHSKYIAATARTRCSRQPACMATSGRSSPSKEACSHSIVLGAGLLSDVHSAARSCQLGPGRQAWQLHMLGKPCAPDRTLLCRGGGGRSGRVCD